MMANPNAWNVILEDHYLALCTPEDPSECCANCHELVPLESGFALSWPESEPYYWCSAECFLQSMEQWARELWMDMRRD